MCSKLQIKQPVTISCSFVNLFFIANFCFPPAFNFNNSGLDVGIPCCAFVLHYCYQVMLMFARVRQAALTNKRDQLRERLNDALELKAGIDRRRSRLDAALRDALSPGELTDFRCAVDSVCRLRLDDQWIDDRLEISQSQLTALLDNILSSSQATEC